jgi:SnoaL-like protein
VTRAERNGASGCGCADRWACEGLVMLYARYIDSGWATRITDLFTEDGIWESEGLRLDGIDAIRAGFAQRETLKNRVSRHVCTNFLVDFIEDDIAEGSTYLVLFRHDGPVARSARSLTEPLLIGQYRDVFRRTPDGWRFARRHFLAAHAAASSEIQA